MIKNISQAPQQPNTDNQLDKRNPKIMAAARGYEQQFIGEMVQAMRQAVPKSGEPESMGERIYKDQLYDQYVEQWTNVGGIGLSDLIYDQIVERFAPQGQVKNVGHLQGPMPLDQKKTFEIQSKPKANNSMELKISPQKNSETSQILSPWTGELTALRTLESGEKVAFVKHDNGLQSTFLFKGKLVDPSKKAFAAGEPIVSLNNESKDYTWKLIKQG